MSELRIENLQPEPPEAWAATETVDPIDVARAAVRELVIVANGGSVDHDKVYELQKKIGQLNMRSNQVPTTAVSINQEQTHGEN